MNTLPLAMLFGGLAVLTFGVAPRLTVALSVSATVAGYLLQVLGPALHWPGWVLDISPFHHLAAVPAEPFAPLPTAVLAALGLAAALAGLAAFEHRDLAGA
jgi:ABC-2 type transport system permease protein